MGGLGGVAKGHGAPKVDTQIMMIATDITSVNVETGVIVNHNSVVTHHNNNNNKYKWLV